MSHKKRISGNDKELQVHIQQIEQIGTIISDSEMKSMIAKLLKHIQEKDGNLVNSNSLDGKTNIVQKNNIIVHN